MALAKRIDSLKKRHAEIDVRLQAENARRSPDALKIHKLKSEKLSIKDEITRLLGGEAQAA